MRILYFFVVNWAGEVADYRRGVVPAHRLFGYAELEKMGHEPSLCPPPKLFGKLIAKPIYWRIYQALYATFHEKKTDAIFVVNEAAAIPALVLKKFGLLKTPIIVFNTGLTHPRNGSGFRKWMWDFLLPCAEAVVSQTEMEQDAVWREFGLRKERQFLIHMLVDVNFFRRDPEVTKGDYVLAVGTNEAKDFPLLMKAMPKEEKLVIVTDPYNAAIVESHREPGMQVEVLQAVPIAKLRKMYQEAKVIVNPLAETPYGSGHTVVLENMVLGNPVIVSAAGGMLDYIEDGVSAIGVKPHDLADLSAKLRDYLANPGKYAHIARQSPEWVRRFSSEEFARKLIAIAGKLCPSATSDAVPHAHAAR